MEKKIMIYGAYGYTGALITEQALSQGLKPILAGRNETETKAIAKKHQLDYRAFSLDDENILLHEFSEIDILINAAGPYSKTARPLVNACISTQTHYLDVTGELEVFEWIATKDDEAKKSGITLLPGCGFDVVPSDCLAAMLKDKMPNATHLSLAFKGVGTFSRGTALTMLENIDKGGVIRENGKIKPVPAAYKTRKIHLKNKDRLTVSIPWGDVSTAYYSTGIPNIIVYMATNANMLKGMKFTRYGGWLLKLPFVQKFLENKVKSRVKGPDANARKTQKSYLWGEVSNEQNQKQALYLETPEGYQLTAITTVLILQKVIAGKAPTGFMTPSKAFGKDLILEVDGSKASEKGK